MAKRVVLVAASDLHLDHVPPAARAEEGEDWYKAMDRPLAELAELTHKHRCPLVIPGDIFNDGWRPHRTPPELVNFVIDRFKRFRTKPLAVPGQHDLPYHRYEEKSRSSYHTLAQARVMTDMLEGVPYTTPEGVMLVGFPWGAKAAGPPPVSGPKPQLTVAVVHRYCWVGSHSYPGASPEDHVGVVPRDFPGFDAVLFGDNHGGFLDNQLHVANCGTFMGRTVDEQGYKPFATMVYEDGTLVKHHYDTSEDRWKDPKDVKVEPDERLERYAEAAASATMTTEDFPAAVRAELKARQVVEAIHKLTLEYLGGK